MKLDRVIITRPGGNDTALVFDPVPYEKYKTVNDYIQQQNPQIEQVMFVDCSQSVPVGTMAGGEFCGNATRSLGYYLLGGKNGTIALCVSGSKSLLTVDVQNGNAKLQMPILNDLNSVCMLDNAIALVRLEGIAHLVLQPGSAVAEELLKQPTIDDMKAFAKKLLEQHDLLREPASGIMALSESEGGLKLLPFVYVKEVNTFYLETACGSGSVAVGLVTAKRHSHSVHDLRIIQPSGYAISVNVNWSADSFESASIEGGVDIIYEGKL